jgi:multidrug resistance efflux pump
VGLSPKKERHCTTIYSNYKHYLTISTIKLSTINYQSDLELADADIIMQRKLYRDKVIPDVEMRQAQSKYLGKKQTYDQAKTSLNNNQMSQNQKRQDILELNKTTTEQTNGLLQAINTLKSDTVRRCDRILETAVCSHCTCSWQGIIFGTITRKPTD